MTRVLLFGARLDGLARVLLERPGVRELALYRPGPAPAERHRLPLATSFTSMLEVATDGAAGALVAELGAIGQLPKGCFAYRVDERRLKSRPRAWADGEPTPGVVLVSPVFRAPGKDAPAFAAHWRERHAPLALEHHVGMCDYRQAIVVERLTAAAPAFDGVARLGFASAHDFEIGLYGSKEGRRAIGEDTARFVDVTRLEVALLEETVLRS